MLRFTQLSNGLTAKYGEAFWNKGLGLNKVYDKYILKNILIEGMSGSILHRIHSHIDPKNNGPVRDLARKQRFWQNLNIFLAMPTLLFTMIKRITDGKLQDTQVVVLIILIRPRIQWLDNFEWTEHPSRSLWLNSNMASTVPTYRAIVFSPIFNNFSKQCAILSLLFANNHPITSYLAFMPQLCLTAVNTHEANLSSISRRTRWPALNSCNGCSATE